MHHRDRLRLFWTLLELYKSSIPILWLITFNFFSSSLNARSSNDWRCFHGIREGSCHGSLGPGFMGSPVTLPLATPFSWIISNISCWLTEASRATSAKS